jgi:small conductance mechanosensitive channel
LPSTAAPAGDDEAYTAVTAKNADVPMDELELLLLPRTRAELEIEAEAWLRLLQLKVTQVSNAEIAVKYKKREIDKVEEAAEAAAEAEQKTAEHEGAKAATEAAAAEEEEAGDVPVELAARVPSITEEALPDTEALEEAAETAEKGVKAKAQVKAALLKDVNELRNQRAALVDRVNLVLDALEEKGGDVEEHRLYISAVSGIRLDVSDTQAAWATLVGWLKSGEGGIQWAKNIAGFIVIFLGFWVVALIVEKLTEKALKMGRRLSGLMRDFIGASVRRIILVVGFVVALGALGVDIGPMLAVIGAAGFVVAFALQDSLGNLASGIMILVYRPFDVGDAVDVSGVAGTVHSMNLVSTTIRTFDNKVVVVPNNKIWGDIITNITGSAQRRVDMVFGIGYDADMAKAQTILEQIVREHPLVLDDPEPVIRVHELADSSVNFICRPWSKTADYWTVFWDVTRAVKEKFDEAGISIPFPQQDIHVRQVVGPASPA